MAEEANTPVDVDANKPVEEQTRPVEASDGVIAAGAKLAEGGDVAPAEAPAEEQAPVTAAAAEDQVAKDEAADAKLDTAAVEKDAVSTAEASATNGESTKKANNNRRKSTGATPEQKSKKTPSKKKKQVELHLDTQPGDMWMVAMRGYQPWPVIICDEEMLPESLLSKRPVSAKRLDGTYRDDYAEGGKNAKDRRYPIMFLGTNEFAWQVNTDLITFSMDGVKKEVAAGNATKKNKNLWEAFNIASEGHDLAWFKDMLMKHEQAMQDDALARQEKEEAKAKKAEKAAKRKSAAREESEDVEMGEAGDVAASGKKKASKKRKKDEDSDGEPEKPAKTPKTKLKLTNKPKDASAAKPKKESKSKKGKASEEEADSAPVEEPPMTEAERLKKRHDSVKYLRHRLQKGLLSRDQAPQDEDMVHMSGYLTQLEDLEDLEAEVIKTTKVHKLLKMIIKLEWIPKEEEYNFKQRSINLLNKWNTVLAADTSASASAPATNGVKHDEENKAEVSSTEKLEKPEKPKQTEETLTSEPAKPTDGDGDVSMAEAKVDATAVKDDKVAEATSV